MDNSSGVGVLDKAAIVLGALETGPTTLAGLVSATGLARPTAHRLAVALEHHRLVSRDLQGRFVLGPPPRRARLRRRRGPAPGHRRAGARAAARHHRRVGADVPPAGRLPGLRGDGRADVGAARQRPGRDAADDEARVPPRRCCSPGRSPTACSAGSAAAATPRSPWPPSAVAAGPTRSASASRASRPSRRRSAPPPARSSPRSASPARSSASPASPGRLHAPAVIAAAERLSDVLRRSGSEG